MGKRGFSVTTAVLVAVLVGALYMVGRTVTPPPPGPPEPPPAVKTVDPHALALKNGGQGASPMYRAKMMQQMKAEEMKRHGLPPKGAPAPKKKSFDPNTIEIKPAWNEGRVMGAAGEAELAEKVRKAKEEEARTRLSQSPAPPPSAAIQPKAPMQPKMAP